MERAYVFAADILGERERRPQGDYRVRVNFAFKNVGRTPAIVVELLASIEFCPNGCPDDATAEPFTKGPIQPGIAIGAGEVVPAGTRSRIITQEQLEQIDAGNGAMMFWGQITYKDVFGREWHSSFGYEIRVYRGGRQSARIRLANCPEMNEYS